MPGIEGLDALRRPGPAREVEARGLDRVGGVQGGLEVGPEPRHEEHHLGGDEHDHAVAVVKLHHAGMVATLGLVDDIFPPGEHHVEDADGARAEDVGGRG